MRNFQEGIYEEPNEEKVWFQKSWYHSFNNKANKYNHHNKWIPGTTPENKWEFPKKTSTRKKCDIKKVDITLSHECFPEKCFDIVSTAFLKPQQKNLHRQKFTEWKTALIPQHLLSRMLSIIFRFSCFFQQVLWSHFNVLSHII